MHEEQTVTLYSVGDRVELIDDCPDDNEDLVIGICGTVCDEDVGGRDVWVPVCWDIAVTRGHDCNGKCESGHGWNVPRSYIRLVSLADINDEDIADLAEIQTMLGIGGVCIGS